MVRGAPADLGGRRHEHQRHRHRPGQRRSWRRAHHRRRLARGRAAGGGCDGAAAGPLSPCVLAEHACHVICNAEPWLVTCPIFRRCLQCASHMAGGSVIVCIILQRTQGPAGARQGLAKSVAWDGEGATCLMEVSAAGAADDAGARAVARAVSASSLVKAAVFGHDPNWGRIACAAGCAPGRIRLPALAPRPGPPRPPCLAASPTRTRFAHRRAHPPPRRAAHPHPMPRTAGSCDTSRPCPNKVACSPCSTSMTALARDSRACVADAPRLSERLLRACAKPYLACASPHAHR